jgi:hypothetical protein
MQARQRIAVPFRAWAVLMVLTTLTIAVLLMRLAV